MINDNAFSKILVPIPMSDQSQTTGVVSFQDPNNSPIGPDVDNNHLLVIVTIVAMQKTLLVMKVNTPGNPPPPMASQSGNFSPYWPWPLITQDPLANIARKSKQICLKVFIQTWNKSPRKVIMFVCDSAFEASEVFILSWLNSAKAQVPIKRICSLKPSLDCWPVHSICRNSYKPQNFANTLGQNSALILTLCHM